MFYLNQSSEKMYYTSINNISTLQMRKMRHREVKRFVYLYLASKCQSQIVNPGNLASEPVD